MGSFPESSGQDLSGVHYRTGHLPRLVWHSVGWFLMKQPFSPYASAATWRPDRLPQSLGIVARNPSGIGLRVHLRYRLSCQAGATGTLWVPVIRDLRRSERFGFLLASTAAF
jgi:hypothetical protein